MAHDARLGLATLPSAAGNTPSYLDARQWIQGDLAARRWLAERLGGPGIYHGGAAVIEDFTAGGARYPAVRLIVYDDGGEAWFFATLGAKPIAFDVTGGIGVLYAVITQMVGVSPAAATGGRAEVSFVVQSDSAPAPAHSLKLGTGALTAGAFTTWTEAAGIRQRTFHVGDGSDGNLALLFDDGSTYPPGIRWNTGSNQVEISHNGTTWVALDVAHFVSNYASFSTVDELVVMAGSDGKLIQGSGTQLSSVVLTSDSRLTDARSPVPHKTTHRSGMADALAPADIGAPGLTSDNTLTGVLLLTNGKLRVVRNAKYGSPPSGVNYGTGDRWWDRAGAMWYCTAGGNPGTWEQLGPGVVPTTNWGSGASYVTGNPDIALGGNWNSGSLLDGYRVHEPGVGEWVRNNGAACWWGLPRETTFAVGSGMPTGFTMTATNDPIFAAVVDDTVDHYLESWTIGYYTAGGAFSGNSWDIILYAACGGVIHTLNIAATSAGVIRTQAVNAPTTAVVLFVKAQANSGPPTIGFWSMGMRFRAVRK